MLTRGSGFICLIAATAASVATLALSSPAQAAIIPVTETTDATPAPPGSLRAAIEAANTAADPDVIDATGVAGTINLQTSLPSVQEDVEIRGPGASTLTVRRAGAVATDVRIFRFLSATAAISGLTIANGRTTDSGDGGAGIYNDSGTLTLRQSVVTGNVNAGTSNGADGGGIVNQSGGPASAATLTIADSTVSANTAAGKGGGIFNTNNSELRVVRSTVNANTSQGGAGCPGGGGIRNAGVLNVVNSTVSGNSAPTTLGGGLATCSTSPSATTIVNSTIASNSSPQAANVGVLGDPVDPITTTFRGTIISDPRGGGDNCQIQDDGILTSQGYNLASDTSCNLTAAADQPSTNPDLGPLASNGGPTRTHAPLAGSPAIDKGIGGGLTIDQRGLTRPVDFPAIPSAPGGDGSDIGAFEVKAPPVPPEAPPSNDFSFGEVQRNKKKGTARLTVIVPGPGELVLAGKKVKGVTEQVGATPAGASPNDIEVVLKVKAKGKGKKKLKRTGKAKLTTDVTYTPSGGEPNTQSKKLKLKKRR